MSSDPAAERASSAPILSSGNFKKDERVTVGFFEFASEEVGLKSGSATGSSGIEWQLLIVLLSKTAENTCL